MKDEGWTLAELEGEMIAQGIDFCLVDDESIYQSLDCPTPEEAARQIEKELVYKE